MTVAQRRNRLTTRFSEGISVVKRSMTVMYSVIQIVFVLTVDKNFKSHHSIKRYYEQRIREKLAANGRGLLEAASRHLPRGAKEK